MKTFLNRLFTTRPARVGWLVLLQLVLVFGVGVNSFNEDAAGNARRWLANDIANFDISKARPLDYASAHAMAARPLKQRLQQQYDQLRARASAHLDIMAYYYGRYYMAISLATIAGIVAAVALLFITRKGWDSASPYLVAVFITMTSIAGFFGAFPAMFEQAKNIEDNKKAYVAYVALENRVLSYVASGSDEDNKPKPLAQFIHELDARLKALHRLPVELNPEAIPDPTESLSKGVK